MSEKATGYSLLAIGIIVIAFAAFSVYSVFTARASAFELFSFDSVNLPVSALVGQELPSAVSDAEVELMDARMINQTTNTFAHLLLMGFIASVGYKVAMLGVNLLRPIVVRVNDQKLKGSILDPK